MKMYIALSKVRLNDFAKNFSDIELRYSNIGSYERVEALLKKFPQIQENKLIYLFAGSWAIEFTSGQKLEHDDIDIILLGSPYYYIDDAVSKEEHCCNVIPLPKNYFTRPKKFIEAENPRGLGKVYVPSLNLQYCFKLIGELDKRLSDRAIKQALLLIKQYSTVINEKEFLDEAKEILKSCLPNNFNSELVSQIMLDSIKEYKKGNQQESEKMIVQAHSLINQSLKNKFKDMGIE